MTELAWADDGSDAAVVARVAAAVARPGPVALCLPGGSTPRPIFAALAAMRLPWDKVTIWPGDERLVPHDHPASNVGALRLAFGATGRDDRAAVPGAAAAAFRPDLARHGRRRARRLVVSQQRPRPRRAASG